MKEGIIKPDSEIGKLLDFTSDKFDGYLWKKGNSIYISFIISLQPNNGNLSKLFDNILKLGFSVKVPTPLGLMEYIVKKKGFKKTFEWWEEAKEWCEVWVKEVDNGRVNTNCEESKT